jgi:hypothetical protein
MSSGGNLMSDGVAFDDHRAKISEGASAPHGAPALTLQNATYVRTTRSHTGNILS